MMVELKEPQCGVACCKPSLFRFLASIKWFTGFYSIAGLVVASLTMYIVSQITTIEKQFGLNSSQTGILLACNDIGYSVMILFASHFATKIHIPRILCASTIFYGISGILCSVPHFIYNYDPPGSNDQLQDNGSSTFNPDSNLCLNVSKIQTTPTNTSGTSTQGTETVAEVRSVAMAFIGIGMFLGGLCKAPRYPLLATYLDDNTNKQETGFFMGIITSLAIFGPALAYGLGGVFSQIYVTLEDVDLNPRDPRWLGAWWIGFLMFGISAIILGVPLMCFPKYLSPKTTRRNENSKRKGRVTCGAVGREIKEFLKNIVRVLKSPLYTITLIGSLVNVLGYSSTLGFAPKYMEKQFNIPAWKANIIMAVVGIVSVCIGTFFGGWLTKKIKLNPPKTLMMILAACIPALLLTLATMFLACEPAVIVNWPSEVNRMQTKMPSKPGCMSQCGCDSDNFLPICGSDGLNYFSPCHAGCSDGLVRTFSNCSCIEGGTAVSGLCMSDCPVFWPWNILNFIISLIGSSVMMPFFVFFLRIVPGDIKSMAMGIVSLCTSLFGWLPGPVIGGKLVDAACVLWNSNGACSHYDITSLRYNMYGVSFGFKAVAVFILALCLWKAWGMRTWPSDDHDKDSDNFGVKMNKPEGDALIGKFTFHSK